MTNVSAAALAFAIAAALYGHRGCGASDAVGFFKFSGPWGFAWGLISTPKSVTVLELGGKQT